MQCIICAAPLLLYCGYSVQCAHINTYLWSDSDGNNFIIPKNTKKSGQYLWFFFFLIFLIIQIRAHFHCKVQLMKTPLI